MEGNHKEHRRIVAIRAVFYSIKYGLLPYCMYESVKHYECSYWQHLKMNMQYAARWISGDVDESDYEFERETNKNF